MRAKLRSLVRVEAALEQRPQDRRIDLRPVERRRLERRLYSLPVERQRGVVVEQPAVEPCHRLEPHIAACRHRSEQARGVVREPVRVAPRAFQHPCEHVVRQQAHVLGEHAEHEAVDEVRHRLRIVAPGRASPVQAQRRSPPRAPSPSAGSRRAAVSPGPTSPI